MLKSIKHISLIMISVVLILLSGCSGGIKGDEAKAHINKFLEAVEAGDYELAESYLHPESPADLQIFFEALKAEEAIDFSLGTEIVKYTGFSSSYYDSTVNGSAYELEFDAEIGKREVEIEIEIVSNDNGYGIYNFDIDT